MKRNTTPKSKILLFKLLLVTAVCMLPTLSKAQTSESCDCTIDTLGLRTYLSTLTLTENAPLQFEVSNSSALFAVLHGYIDATTPTVVQTFINTYPNVTTLVFMQIAGSADDDANLLASQTLKNQGLKFYLPAVNAYAQDAFIASGGVDMFLAGDTRVIDLNGEVGVHSWSDGTNDATGFPVGHAFHLPYINYYVSMGFSQADAEAFYYFTINAASANSIHNMTETEIENYKLRTCKYAAAPTYTISTNGNTISANLSGATSYQWIDCNSGNSPISGALNQNFTVTSNGNYAVQITENSCSGTSPCILYNTVGLTKNQSSFSGEIYPNPTNGTITVSQKPENTFEILDSLGKTVFSVKNSKKNSLTINIKHLNSGIYFLKLKDGSVKKIILN